MKQIIKRNYLLILLIVLLIGTRFFSKGFIPDYLHLSDILPKEIFGLLISATASIIGVVIAVILLTFDLSKGGFFRRKEDSILNHPIVIRIITLFIVVMVSSLVAYCYIQDFRSPADLTMVYYLLILFVFFVVTLFPSIRKILETTNLLNRTLAEIERLESANFFEVIQLQWDKFSFNDNNRLLIRIRQQLIIYIREHDYEAYTTTLIAINRKAIQLIGEGKDRRNTDNITEALCFLWESAQTEALRVQNIQYFNTVWECMELLYDYAAVKKIPLMYLQSLDFYSSKYVNFLTRNGLKEPLYKGVNIIVTSFKLNLKNNCPAQELVNDLYWTYEQKETYHYIDDSIQWDHIINFLMDLFGIQDSAITLKDNDLFYECDSELKHLYLGIINGEYPNLGVYQEAAIIEQIFRIRTENVSAAVKSAGFFLRLTSFDLESSHIADLALSEKFYVAEIMQTLSDFILKLQYEEKLTAGLLNFWTATGRHLSKYYLKNKLCTKAFDFIVVNLIHLKEYIEAEQFSSSQAIYKEVEKQTESLKRYLEKNLPGKRLPIKTRLNKTLKEFKPVIEVPAYDIIKW